MTKEILEKMINTIKIKNFYGAALTLDECKDVLKVYEENQQLKAMLNIGKTCGFCPYYKAQEENKELKQQVSDVNFKLEYEKENLKFSKDYLELQQENERLKEQLEFERQCQNRFFKINNKTYDGRIVLAQLKQRDEVIDEAINICDIVLEHEPLEIKPNEDLLDYISMIKKTLQKYKGDNNGQRR